MAQSYTDSWFYYVKAQKIIGSHVLSLSVTGAPSKNSARGYQQRIATHSKDYAQSLVHRHGCMNTHK